jgi:hypothetical protein
MSGWAQAATVVAAVVGVGGVQAFWIARALDAVTRRLDRVDDRLDVWAQRMDMHGQRLAKLEG